LIQMLAMQRLVFSEVLMRCGRPGLAPAGDSLFFASPKKSKQKKGEPAVCVPQQSCGQPAVLAAGGGPLELGYRLKQSRALIHLHLRSSAQTEGRWTAQLPLSNPLVALRATLLGACDWGQAQNSFDKRLSKSARATQSAVLLTAVEAGLSSAAAGGSGLALFERSEFSQTPPDVSSARNRAAARPSARFSFAYFSLAKQRKVSRPPGRDPACHRHKVCDAFQPTQQRN
jgi:hypothetical protein